jgi:hypothetical protein
MRRELLFIMHALFCGRASSEYLGLREEICLKLMFLGSLGPASERICVGLRGTKQVAREWEYLG